MALRSFLSARRRCRQEEVLRLQHGFCCRLSSSFVPVNEIPKTYNPTGSEERILEKWKTSRSRQKRTGSPVFRMILPPPNVTGKLHLGHFLTVAVEDTVARWKLMTGLNVEWIPGFDHAGIATQSVVNRKMSKMANQDQDDICSSLEEFSNSNLEKIKEQLIATGAILDWEKTYYTLDENHSSVVKDAFIQLFESGLIRRADGIVNWSCALRTTIADVEVENIQFDSKISLSVPNYKYPVDFGLLYTVVYSVIDSDKSISVATSRPETMFGDVALAVNPEDCRYAEFIGKRVTNPVNGSIMPIVGDLRVKPDFGTGVVKVTPAHDKLDFAIGASQDLKPITIFTPDGHLNEKCGEFEGLPRFFARMKVLELLKQRNAITAVNPYSGSVGVCSRSGDVIEPRLLPHWFLHTQFLSNKLIDAISDKSFLIVPENHARSLVHKLAESQDWCLSRQIKWGHQIPAYHHINHPDKWVTAKDVVTAVAKLDKLLGLKVHAQDVVQDKDVLDTWFSSALIPLAISDWPDSENFKEITLMETGHDILLFWVWRMTIISLALINRFPFRNVLLHGVVTDHLGRKMSKSKGNVIDPVHIVKGVSYKELVEEADDAFASGELDENEYSFRKVALQKNHLEGFQVCGPDALRLTLLSQNIFDQDVVLDLNNLDTCRRFTNKMWQALRFLKLTGEVQDKSLINPNMGIQNVSDDLASRWILACLYEFNLIAETSLNQAKFHLYAESIRKFFYHELCDIFIELVKCDLRTGSDVSKSIKVMQYVFETGLKVAHPLIPFVTEEIWSYLKNDLSSCLLDQDFPSSKSLEQFCNPGLITTMAKAMHLTREIRSVKRKSNCSKGTTPLVYIEVETALQQQLHNLNTCIANLSSCEITFGKYPDKDKGMYGSFLFDLAGSVCRIHIPLMDPAARLASRTKMEKLKLKLMKLQQQYDNPAFQKSAPPDVKEKLKKRLDTLIMQIDENNQKENPNPVT